MRAAFAVPLSTTAASMPRRSSVVRAPSTRCVARGLERRTTVPSGSRTSRTSIGSISRPPLAIAA